MNSDGLHIIQPSMAAEAGFGVVLMTTDLPATPGLTPALDVTLQFTPDQARDLARDLMRAADNSEGRRSALAVSSQPHAAGDAWIA